jgi:hypothetical protein
VARSRRPLRNVTSTGLVAVSLLWLTAASVLGQDQPPPEPGTIGIGLAEAPVDRRDDPRGLTHIVDHVQPGAVFSRRIRVANGHDRRVSLDIYATAADLVNGAFVVRDGRGGAPVADWITVEPSTVTVEPRSRSDAVVTVSVPRDAERGEHHAAVLAEYAPGGEEGVFVASRVGIRVYLSVGSEGEPPTDFRIDSLEAGRDDAGVATVRANVENTGERAIDLSGELSLSDGPAGLSAGPFPARGVATLARGQTGSFLVPLDPTLPAGPWTALLVARSGTMERSAEATITFPEAAGTTSDPVDATPIHRDRGVLLPLAFGLLLLALFLVSLVWWLKRRKDEERDHGAADRPAQSATAVAE